MEKYIIILVRKEWETNVPIFVTEELSKIDYAAQHKHLIQLIIKNNKT